MVKESEPSRATLGWHFKKVACSILASANLNSLISFVSGSPGACTIKLYGFIFYRKVEEQYHKINISIKKGYILLLFYREIV